MRYLRTKAERQDSDGPSVDLYRQDFHAWATEQARALHRAGEGRARGDARALRDALSTLDFENLSEELAGLGRSELRELRHRLATVVEHLLKLQFSPATDPRAGWRSTVQRGRVEIARLLEDSPSLKAELPASLDKAKADAAELVPAELADRGEAPVKGLEALAMATTIDQATRDYTLDRVQDRDWWPDDPLDVLTEAINAYSVRFPEQGLPFLRTAGSRERHWAAARLLRAAVEAGEPLTERALDALGIQLPPPDAPA